MGHFFTRAHWSRVDQVFGAITLLLFVGWLLLPFFGRIDGEVSPVTSHATLTRADGYPPPEYRHVWAAYADKYRDCDFVRVEWYFGSRDGAREHVPSFFLDKPQLRPVGDLVWDGLVISMPPRDVLSHSFAYVYHRCPIVSPRLLGGLRIMRPWETRTLFYDAPEAHQPPVSVTPKGGGPARTLAPTLDKLPLGE